MMDVSFKFFTLTLNLTFLPVVELEFSLNSFSFAWESSQMFTRMAIGTTIGPNYANLFVCNNEIQIF